MLDRISLGRFLCLSGFLWLLYGLNGAWYGVRLGLSVHSSCTVTTLRNLEMPYTVIVPTIALYRVTQPCLVFLTGMLQRLPVLLRVPFSALFQYLL